MTKGGFVRGRPFLYFWAETEYNFWCKAAQKGDQKVRVTVIGVSIGLLLALSLSSLLAGYLFRFQPALVASAPRLFLPVVPAPGRPLLPRQQARASLRRPP